MHRRTRAAAAINARRFNVCGSTKFDDCTHCFDDDEMLLLIGASVVLLVLQQCVAQVVVHECHDSINFHPQNNLPIVDAAAVSTLVATVPNGKVSFNEQQTGAHLSRS